MSGCPSITAGPAGSRSGRNGPHSGDVLVFRALDRIASSERMAIDTLTQLRDRGIEVRSLTEAAIDQTTAVGTFVYSIMAALAQLRVDTTRENTMLGLAHARSPGRVGACPSLKTPERIEAARPLRPSTPPQSSHRSDAHWARAPRRCGAHSRSRRPSFDGAELHSLSL